MRVADNGAGIPEDDRERVFERCHRTNEPAFRNIPGTELGLYLSRQLAEARGGSLVIKAASPVLGPCSRWPFRWQSRWRPVTNGTSVPPHS